MSFRFLLFDAGAVTEEPSRAASGEVNGAGLVEVELSVGNKLGTIFAIVLSASAAELSACCNCSPAAIAFWWESDDCEVMSLRVIERKKEKAQIYVTGKKGQWEEG